MQVLETRCDWVVTGSGGNAVNARSVPVEARSTLGAGQGMRRRSLC